MITVYHSVDIDGTRDNFFLRDAERVRQHWSSGGYVKVAEVPVEAEDADTALEIAWRKTNSVNENWFERKDITIFRSDADGIRSSMVGDVFVMNGVSYYVAVIGFKEIDL